jgi:hypothetical protein
MVNSLENGCAYRLRFPRPLDIGGAELDGQGLKGHLNCAVE